MSSQISQAGSTRPYLIRAIYEWAVDNGLTPHVLVDAQIPGVQVPAAYVQEGRIALNIHPRAVEGLQLGRDSIMFSARFSGRTFEVTVPVSAVLAIYARENGRGFFFQKEPDGEGPMPGAGGDSPSPPSGGRPPGRKGVSLKRVK
ncbi:MAG: ClpXP protease specificity-enhancing factor [Gammaproteobacteria bacterium]|nr:ClpXP protease specificity-enhancing factor [Gammaproteobacteria bacterium]